MSSAPLFGRSEHLKHNLDWDRRTGVAGVLELVVPRYPYKIYYRIEGEEIWVVHIRDARRAPWPAP